MHSQQRESEHIILMTEEEFQRYNKRLYAVTERGFKVEVYQVKIENIVCIAIAVADKYG